LFSERRVWFRREGKRRRKINALLDMSNTLKWADRDAMEKAKPTS